MSHPASVDSLILDAPIQLEFVRVPAGEFYMGSDPARDNFAKPDEMPRHCVYLSEFYIGKYEVTSQQFADYARASGTAFESPAGKDDHPAVRVSWDEAVAFCQWLSQATGRHMRLPTEAEWEKAARGTDGRLYPWGDKWDPTWLNSNEGGASDTTPVTKFTPAGDSPYGASDMVGNVWEWTADWYNANLYEELAKSGVTAKDPTGPASGSHRVMRGGSWYYRRSGARAAYRFKYVPTFRCYDIGFRVVVDSR
jgi:formylglycine-generating enzyme required for sulfatase activity